MSYDLWTLIKPSAFILELLIFGAVLLIGRYRHWGVRIVLLASGLLVILAVVPGWWLLMRPLEAWAPAPPAAIEPDVILVLSGGEKVALSNAHRQPQFDKAGERILMGATLAHRHTGAMLIHSGDSGGPIAVGQAKVAAQAYRSFGIAESRIQFETKATNTCESIANVDVMLGAPPPSGKLLLVTSAFHMPRVAVCAEKVGLDFIPYPVDYRVMPSTPSLLEFGYLLENLDVADTAAHEWGGLLFYRVTGRSESIWPEGR